MAEKQKMVFRTFFAIGAFITGSSTKLPVILFCAMKSLDGLRDLSDKAHEEKKIGERAAFVTDSRNR